MLRVRINTASITRLLKQTKENLQTLPQCPTDDPPEPLQLTESEHHVLINATARSIQRPQKPSRQKTSQRKEGFHTVNHTTVSETDQCILRHGDTIPGSQRDDLLLKAELNPKRNWFASTEAAADLSYPGTQTDASSPNNVHIPDQKNRGSQKRILILHQRASNSESIAESDGFVSSSNRRAVV